MRDRTETIGWSVVALVLIALAVPWFMWGSDAVVAGLPVWIWWHVGWMALASLAFAAFARYGWGAGVVPREDRSAAANDGDSTAQEVTADG
ncbi:DUF3311 domain-containing protein [Halomicrobium urmianum]|uniref:DUF3311 domain-containing protein n=1 Tax=Halomicrobium urmianum TaxID=1586233 RepID=UPI001CD9BC78|nr:DUF3311 domain-containing protein [Halomicrobium urmianum]